MAQVRFIKPHRADFAAPVGSNLMQALLAQKIPVASSCKGDGICGKCRIRIVEGAQNLSPIGELESLLLAKNNLQSPWRISCQSTILGDITVDTGYW